MPLLLDQINGTAFDFLENHPNVDAKDTLKDHRDRARDCEDQDERCPARNELVAVPAKPHIGCICQFKGCERNEQDTEEESDP